MHDIGENVKPVKWRTEHELAFYARRTVYYFRNLAVGKRGQGLEVVLPLLPLVPDGDSSLSCPTRPPLCAALPPPHTLRRSAASLLSSVPSGYDP